MTFISLLILSFIQRSLTIKSMEDDIILENREPTIMTMSGAVKPIVYIQTLPVNFHYPSYSPTKNMKQTITPSLRLPPRIIDHPDGQPMVIYKCSPITPNNDE
jgi:hypothetical protein